MVQLSDQEYQAAIDILIQLTRKIFSNHILDLKYVQNDVVQANLLSSLQTARSMNREVNWWIQRCMYTLIFKRVTKMLKQCSKYVNQTASYDRSSSVLRGSIQIEKTIKKIDYKHSTNPNNSDIINSKTIFLELALATHEEKQKQEQNLAISSLAGVFPHLNSLLRKLRKTYNIAEKSATTAEEEYFMEQIMNNYLPTMETTMLSVQHASLEMREKVERELVKQVTLMGENLRVIIDRSALRVLKEAEVQTEFLSQKFNPPANTLSLQKNLNELAP